MRRGPTTTSRPTQLPKPQPLLVGSPEAGQSLLALLMLTFYSHPSFGDVMQLGTFPRNPYLSPVLAPGLPRTHMRISPIVFSPPPSPTHTHGAGGTLRPTHLCQRWPETYLLPRLLSFPNQGRCRHTCTARGSLRSLLRFSKADQGGRHSPLRILRPRFCCVKPLGPAGSLTSNQDEDALADSVGVRPAHAAVVHASG